MWTNTMEWKGKLYHYKGKVIGVIVGLGNTFFVGLRGQGGKGSAHRLKLRALPICNTAEEMQTILDAWATGQKLGTAEGWEWER